jgi:hypothetical protein
LQSDWGTGATGTRPLRSSSCGVSTAQR